MEFLPVITTLFGVLMSFGYFTQTYKIIKMKSARDVSFATYLFFTVGIVIWLVYGLSVGDYPIIISNAVFLIGALSVLVVYLIYRK